MFSAWLLAITLSAVAWSWRRDPSRTRAALRVSAKSLAGLLPGLLAMTALIGLVLALGGVLAYRLASAQQPAGDDES